jgi:NAD(P)H-dependent flavin oxidoreductase YrpB (nitropropane dioxygenase family)
MGVAVSSWKLANAVSRLGQLGVISGTALDTVLVRRLEAGDPGGHMRRAIEKFPIPQIASEVLHKYFHAGGLPPGKPFTSLPMHRQVINMARERLTVLSSFVEVTLAREGHDGLVGMNLLTKLQASNLALLYGAMIGGVHFILMGAGIPREIPGALDLMALHQPAALRLEVEGQLPDQPHYLRFDPAIIWEGSRPELRRPNFLPIIASNSLATMMVRKASGRVNGLVIEGPTAGGHNAPPRGGLVPDEKGEIGYGPRDEVDLSKIAELGVPFWIAGGAGSPDGLKAAQSAGAAGIQVGTLFAYCDESGIEPALKSKVLGHAARGEVQVITDWRASPTGYPFKVVNWGEPEPPRERVCDLGYLRTAYPMANGRLGFRCASEPEKLYVAKGGKIEETVGRKCLCNSLLATIGLAQGRDDGTVEPPMVTSGDDLMNIGKFLGDRTHYAAADVLDYLLERNGA